MEIGLFNYNHTIIESAYLETNNSKMDIVKNIISYEFTESIFSYTMYGTIIINDNADLLNKNYFKFNGEEKITITVKNLENNVFTYTWILADVELENKNTMADNAIVVISLVTKDFFKNSYTFRSKGYIKSNRTEVIRRILKEELKSEVPHNTLFFDFDTRQETSFAFTKIRPFEKIDILVQQMFDDRSDGLPVSTYVFFEDRYGYNLVSFEKIMNQSQSKNEKTFIYSQNMAGNKFSDPLFNGIKSFESSNRNNNLNKIINGLYFSEVYRFDFTTKRITVEKYSLKDDKDKFAKLAGDNSNLTNTTDNFLDDVEKYGKYTYFIPWDSSRQIQDLTYKHFQYSKQFLYLLEENTLNIFIDGTLSIRLGDPIITKIWKNSNKNEIEENLDDRYSGKFIVQSLTNTIYRGSQIGTFVHDTSVSLTRDTNVDSNKIKDDENRNTG